MDTDFHKIINDKGQLLNPPKEITIGNHVWIGCKCLLLKGAKIPDGSIIAANSFINKPLEINNSIYIGNLVKPVKSDIIWKR